LIPDLTFIMETIFSVVRPLALTLLILANVATSTRAQEVSIPDPGLNAAIHEALQIPDGPLTEPDLLSLVVLHARSGNISNLQGLEVAQDLALLDLQSNQLSSTSLPAGLTRLGFLDVSANQLTSLTVPTDMTNLNFLFITHNQLTILTLPAGLDHLRYLDLTGNQLTSLTLPSDLTNLTTLLLGSNPLKTFVLSELMAATTLTSVVDSLRNQGVSVFTYPLAVRLVSPSRTLIGAFEFTITGPPGLYSVLGSADLSTWHEVGVATNNLGSAAFTDATTILSPRRFYRALRQTPPANTVFIPPNTFTMGSPTNEQDRSIFEGPQTTVTLTLGL
jgi:hypothetical protein